MCHTLPRFLFYINISITKNSDKQTQKMKTEDPLIGGTYGSPSGSGPISFEPYVHIFNCIIIQYILLFRENNVLFLIYLFIV